MPTCIAKRYCSQGLLRWRGGEGSSVYGLNSSLPRSEGMGRNNYKSHRVYMHAYIHDVTFSRKAPPIYLLLCSHSIVN